MKILTSAALAGALAISTLAATEASADRWHGKPAYHGYNSGNVGAALAAGAFLGFAFGALATPTYGPYYYPYAYAPPPPPLPIFYPRPASAHIAWCTSQYGAWYNAATDTWTDYYGAPHRCIAPY